VSSRSALAVGLVSGALLAGCSGGGDAAGAPRLGAAGQVTGRVLVAPHHTVEAEPNDSLGGAQDLAVPHAVSGYAAATDSGEPIPGARPLVGHDIFRFTADRPVRLTLTLASGRLSRDDLDLVVLDAPGIEVARSELPESSVELVETEAAGTYYVAVAAARGASPYVLAVEPLDAPGAAFVPGELLVGLRGPAGARAPAAMRRVAERLAVAHGFVAAEATPGGVLRLSATAATRARAARPRGRAVPRTARARALRALTLDAARRLARDPDVRYVEPNYLATAAAAPADPFVRYQWHYDLMNLPSAWDLARGTADVVVAVIDSGIVSAHPDLAGRLRLDLGYDFVSERADAGDGDGRDPSPEDPGRGSSHGTHVAGTIGAATDNGVGVAGVTWATGVMPVRVLGVNGWGSYADIAEAIRYAAGLPNGSGHLPARRADVINLSLAGSASSETLHAAVRDARAAGVVIVAAAGNAGGNAPAYPAAFPEVVSVAAVDARGVRAPYSNVGHTMDVAAPGGTAGVDVNGDGLPDEVVSTDRDGGEAVYGLMQGTSMAAPHVSGVVALMLAANRGLLPEDVDLLLRGAHPSAPGTRITRDLGIEGPDTWYGHGLLDARLAVEGALALAGRTVSGSVLALAAARLDFGASLDRLHVDVANGGTGSLAVTAVSADVPWLTVGPAAGSAPLSLALVVDRLALAPGRHTGTLTVTSDATAGPQTATVAVDVEVGATDGGDVGLVYVLLVDPDGRTVRQAVTTPLRDYAFSLDAVPAGTYWLYAGTDRDDDLGIADAAEACGRYPVPLVVDGGETTALVEVGNPPLVPTCGITPAGSASTLPLPIRRP
jgi:serine protease